MNKEEEYTVAKKQQILAEIVKMATEDYDRNKKDIKTLIEVLQLAKKIENKNAKADM